MKWLYRRLLKYSFLQLLVLIASIVLSILYAVYGNSIKHDGIHKVKVYAITRDRIFLRQKLLPQHFLVAKQDNNIKAKIASINNTSNKIIAITVKDNKIIKIEEVQ